MKIIMGEDIAKTRKIELPITGMTCAACAAAVEKATGKIDGVKSAAVNFAAEKAILEIEIPVDLVETVEGSVVVQPATKTTATRAKAKIFLFI